MTEREILRRIEHLETEERLLRRRLGNLPVRRPISAAASLPEGFNRFTVYQHQESISQVPGRPLFRYQGFRPRGIVDDPPVAWQWDVDWTDPKYARAPGVPEVIDLFWAELERRLPLVIFVPTDGGQSIGLQSLPPVVLGFFRGGWWGVQWACVLRRDSGGGGIEGAYFKRFAPREIYSLSNPGEPGQTARFVALNSTFLSPPGSPYDPFGNTLRTTPVAERQHAGKLFRYGANGWAEAPEGARPDVLAGNGETHAGDYITPQYLQDLQDAIKTI